MANATKDVQTAERESYLFSYPVAAAQTIYRGTILGSVMVSTIRYARAYQAGDVVVGTAQNYVDNSAGANGDKQIAAKRGVVCYAQNGTITDANIGQWAKPVDNQSVALEAVPATATANTCGRIEAVGTEGVWVDFRRYGASA